MKRNLLRERTGFATRKELAKEVKLLEKKVFGIKTKKEKEIEKLEAKIFNTRGVKMAKKKTTKARTRKKGRVSVRAHTRRYPK